MKIKSIFLSVIFTFLCACTNSHDAVKALTAIGFTNIEMTGFAWFACSGEDWYSTGFSATNPQGLTVEGAVCSGLYLKNSTIRFS